MFFRLKILRFIYLEIYRYGNEFAEREGGFEYLFKQLRDAQNLIIMDLQMLCKKIKKIKNNGNRLKDNIKKI